MELKEVVLHSDCHINVASDAETSRPSSSTRRKIRGLLLGKGIWHIDKVLFGKRICESTHTSDLKEAEMLLAHRVSEARRVHLYGEPKEHTFREAGHKFLKENQHKRTIERDVRALKATDPFIGALPLRGCIRGRWSLSFVGGSDAGTSVEPSIVIWQS